MNEHFAQGNSGAPATAHKAASADFVAKVTQAETYLPEFSARITAFRQHTGLGVNDFGVRCGISGGQASKLFSGKANISANKLRGIFAAFPDLNPDWLINGRGHMMLSTQERTPYQLPEGKDPLQALRELVLASSLDSPSQQDLMTLTFAIEDKMKYYRDELLKQHADYTKLTKALIEQINEM